MRARFHKSKFPQEICAARTKRPEGAHLEGGSPTETFGWKRCFFVPPQQLVEGMDWRKQPRQSIPSASTRRAAPAQKRAGLS